MSAENLRDLEKETTFPPPIISRRKILQIATGLGFTALTLSVPILSSPSKKEMPSKSLHAGQTLYPGWIEANVDVPLIEAKKGHTSWLKQAVFRNPMVHSLTADFCQHIEYRAEAGNRLALGETLFYCINKARQTLAQVDKNQVAPDTNMDLESIHLGAIAFAAGFSTWLDFVDMRALGISISKYRDVTDYYWNKDRGISRRAFPRLFGLDEDQVDKTLLAPEGQTRFTGEDRTIHFSQHLFLAFEYLYSLRFNLSDHKTLPLMLKIPMWFGSTAENKAQIFSERVGSFYELASLQDPDNWPIFKEPRMVDEGFFDSMLEADYKGNAFGANTAIALWRNFSTGKSIDSVIQELNDPKFSRLETPATLSG